MLDGLAGVQLEGEAPPVASPEDRLAMTAWKYLSTDGGSIDFAGLPLVVELLGIDDVEGLLLRLLVIKHHAPPTDTEE